MTTEPKFVPNEAIGITLQDNAKLNVRLIDCVGYVIPGAMGHIENEAPRMVQTPWSAEPLAFEVAAEIGTKKVINEHSTIGLVVTTDGSITDIPREDYVMAEERVVDELKAAGKPFIVLLNSIDPETDEAKSLAGELEEKYGVPVMSVSCADLDEGEIEGIMERILFEFPLREIIINMPSWLNGIADDHWLKADMFSNAVASIQDIYKIRESKGAVNKLLENENVAKVAVDGINLGDGIVTINVTLPEELFYKIISESSGIEVDSDDKLLTAFVEFAKVKKEYDKFAPALYDVKTKGYGIVSPTIDELTLEEPEIIRHGSKYGVRLSASAPSIHMIRADIETEVNPIVGTERQSEELITYMLKEFDDDPIKIWDSNIFGKSLNELVNEGLRNKLDRMPDDARMKLQETLTKIINEGSGGLICIIL
jgi:stage IV sporulation protein A